MNAQIISFRHARTIRDMDIRRRKYKHAAYWLADNWPILYAAMMLVGFLTIYGAAQLIKGL